MKAKLFSLMTLSILALVLVIGLTSAAVTFTPNTFTQTVEQGNSVSVSFTATETGIATIAAITFDAPVAFTSTTTTDTFNSGSSVSGAISSLVISQTSGAMSLTANVPEYQTPATYTGTLTLTGDGAPYTLLITITVTEKPRPLEVSDCLAIGDLGDLMELEIEDITVVSGLGEDDTEWVPLDTVEVEVRVENTEKDFKLEDVELGWGLYDLDTQEWVFDEEETDFNIKDGDERNLIFTYTLEDPDDFADGGNFVFYVWANAVGEEFDAPVCRAVSEDIDVVVESDFLILGNLQIEGIDLDEDNMYPGKLSCGSKLQLTADLWNIGDSDQEDIELRVYNNDFGVDETLEIGDVDSFDKESISFEFTVPEGMEEGWNVLELTIQEDGDVFENDYTDEDAEFEVSLDLENCFFAQALVSASLESGGKAGGDLIVRATITNTGNDEATYLVNAFGYAEWASSATIAPNTIVLQAGQSADALITLDVNKGVSGERLFNIEVLSEGEIVMSQPLSVSIEKSLLGNVFGDNGLLTALIIAVAVILVVIIIVLTVRVARK